MKAPLQLLISLFLGGMLYAQDTIIVGETLEYTAGFRFFAAGEATMELKADSSYNPPLLCLTSKTQTNSLLDRFYRVRDRIRIWMDPSDLSLLRQEKLIQEGKYNDHHAAHIDTVSRLATYENGSTELPGKVYDPIGAIYYIRTFPLDSGIEIPISTYDNGKVREIIARVVKTDRVAVPAGIFNCWVVIPAAADNQRLLKNEGKMKIWYTADEKQLPVRIEQKTNIGTMVLELKKTTLPEPETLEDSSQVIIEHNRK